MTLSYVIDKKYSTRIKIYNLDSKRIIYFKNIIISFNLNPNLIQEKYN